MDGDDPDSFESNLGRILRARELGKTAALMSNLIPKASAPQLVGVSSKDNTQCETHCCTSSHCQSDSEDWPDDHETSTEWKCEGYLYFATARWPAGQNLWIRSPGRGEGAGFTSCSHSCPQCPVSSAWKCFTIRRETPTLGMGLRYVISVTKTKLDAIKIALPRVLIAQPAPLQSRKFKFKIKIT